MQKEKKKQSAVQEHTTHYQIKYVDTQLYAVQLDFCCFTTSTSVLYTLAS